jgi:hypothetical protein
LFARFICLYFVIGDLEMFVRLRGEMASALIAAVAVAQSSNSTSKAMSTIVIKATIRTLPSWKAPPPSEELLRPTPLRPDLLRTIRFPLRRVYPITRCTKQRKAGPFQ